MLKEILPDFGQDPDGDVMGMESKSMFKQILDRIIKSTRDIQGWKVNTTRESVLETSLDKKELL